MTDLMTRDRPKVHASIEATSQAQQDRCWSSPYWKHDWRCPYCGRRLWTEYIEGARYLVKCDIKCRIVYVWAGSPWEALEEVGVRLRPRDEWHEDYGQVMWWNTSNPEEPPQYIGGCLDYPEMPAEYQWWAPFPHISVPTPEVAS